MTEQEDFFLGFERDEEVEEVKEFRLPSTYFLTHAVVLGASGSGKTVMCKSIVEEAIRSKIPVIAFDPKGDIGALGISFGKDFDPNRIMTHAIVEGEDRGKDPHEIAEAWVSLYKEKLEECYGDSYASVEGDYSDKVAVILITPKNPAGVQISLTPDFTKPKSYEEMMEETPDSVLSSIDLKLQLLLSRCGIKGASSTDSRIVFLNHLVRHSWEEKNKKSVSLSDIIGMLETPPFKKVGNLSVDKFISKSKREELARLLNALMVRAVPGVELDFDKLIDLAKKDGKVPIISFDLRKIQDEDERTSFVAEVLGEVQRWAWSKGGTSRLRTIVYFDELYGFMPAGSRSPPSKTALLILLKQARAAGVGCILATQNPGDLDYRGLSNISTWILGRLTTPQDIAKVESALKAVFEATGGSEKEFRKLMQSMRALQPGQFIAYNPKTGVVPIRTRWLLSLHKGPLTNKEVKELTLKPPKKEKKKKKVKKTDEEVKDKEKLDISGTSGISAIVPVNLVAKKPKVGKHVERFLKKRMKWKDNKVLVKLIEERLNLSSLEKNKVEILKAEPFYAPIYNLKIPISIKREIEAGSSTDKIPIELTSLMERTFDLSKPIEWDLATVEGIHPDSVPPQEQVIEPSDTYKFLEFDTDTLDKIDKNINWYFTSSPFPEAENLFFTQIRKYEKQEIEKLAETDPKGINKLSTQIMTLEEKLQDQNDKIKIYEKRLERLQADRNALSAEGRALKAVDRSIESAEKQLAKIDEKISEFKSKLDNLEEKRESAFTDEDLTYKELKRKLAFIKNQGLPMDFYKPGKADIKIEEETIYWIPRALIDLKITLISQEKEINLKFNFNMFNGNGDIICKGCGPDISTQSYFQRLLEAEVSPPTFLCNVCFNPFCSEHIEFCDECGSIACYEHAGKCLICNKAVCDNCSIICAICSKRACNEHSWECSSCGKTYCVNEKEISCVDCETKMCSTCAEGKLLKCSECGKYVCEEHKIACESCGKIFCSNHVKECRSCKRKVCSSCGNVKAKLKGEEVIIRCAECS